MFLKEEIFIKRKRIIFILFKEVHLQFNLKHNKTKNIRNETNNRRLTIVMYKQAFESFNTFEVLNELRV